jgi:hypothetical protein
MNEPEPRVLTAKLMGEVVATADAPVRPLRKSPLVAISSLHVVVAAVEQRC